MMGTRLLVAAPLMAVLMTSAAQAALTADQVWADLQTAAAEGGLRITVATEVGGDGELTLNGVTVDPEGDGAVLTMSELSLVEQDDGSVAFFPGEIKIEGAGPATIGIVHDALSVSVFEDEAGLGYGIDASSLQVSVDVEDGEGEARTAYNGKFDLTALGGRYTRGADALDLELGIERMVYTISQKDPAFGLDSVQSSDTADLVLTGSISLPKGLDLMSLQDGPAFLGALRNGLGLTLAMTQGQSTGDLVDNNAALPMSLAYTAQPGTTSVVLNGTSFAIDTSVEGTSITARPPMVPAPVSGTTGVFAMGFAMPMVTADAGGAYGLTLKLADLVLDDAGWDMFDPAKALERGPVNMDVDLGGLLKIDTLDLIQSSEAGTPPASMPELLSLDIRTLGLSALGAALSGTGAFTFDNSMVAAGGPPMPIGTADLRLEGGNKVIDALIKLGVMTEEDAMGARMMMAMFGKTEGDDVLTSKIEAREGGSIFVNGQQIQ